MKTIALSNGTECAMFQEKNCFICSKYNYEEPNESCEAEIKIGFGVELSDEEFKDGSYRNT